MSNNNIFVHNTKNKISELLSFIESLENELKKNNLSVDEIKILKTKIYNVTRKKNKYVKLYQRLKKGG